MRRLCIDISQESRNIAQDVRDKMRRLDTTMKANLIKQNQNAVDAPPSTPRSVSRPRTGKGAKTDDTPLANTEDGKGTKKSRPRSLTFTLTRGRSNSNTNDGSASPSKKHKSSRSSSHVRKKSTELSRSSSATSFNSVASAAVPVPEDFIAYLRTVRQPQKVEVGRIQKLSQLLRNETVTWVDEFIMQGGMEEVIGLLYRIIEIEWR